MQPDDLYRIRSVTDVALSADGALAVYGVGWADQPTDSNRSVLWVLDGDGARQLTFGHADSQPRFSPDGRWLAYLSVAAPREPAQLRLLPLRGGEPITLSSFDDGCGEAVWLPDASRLVVSAVCRPEAEVGLTREELAARPRIRRIDRARYRYNGRGWTWNRWRHLFVLGLDGSCRQLTCGDWDDESPTVSPSGDRVAFLSARNDDRDLAPYPAVWTVPLDGGAGATGVAGDRSDGADGAVAVVPPGGWSSVSWLRDGSLLLLGKPERGEVRLTTPWLAPADGSAPPRRLGGGETSVQGVSAGGPAVVAEVAGAVILPGLRRGRTHLDRYPLDGGPPTTVVGGDRSVGTVAATVDGARIVHTASTATRPYELFDGEQQLTDLNAAWLAEVSLATPEEITATADDGYPVHGWVYRPSASAANGAGLVYVHGGPLAQYGLSFLDELQLAAAGGFTVVAGNPRGSDGYGQHHASCIVGDLGDRDWADVTALSDHLAALPEVDPTRLGIGGGSYGGFMATWAIGHSDRFSAALSERAVTNWETMQGTSDIGAWFNPQYLGGATTLSDLEAVRRQSPMSYVAAVATPTLIIHSEEDWRCPPEQAEQLFVALRLLGVPCEFVRVPGENHELTRSGRPSFRVERFEIVDAWWRRWLVR
jgi:dipeptidyl aminopeptidase/acylaminoacyl peptidase